MKKQVLINEISLMIATIFFIVSVFTNDIYVMIIGFTMIVFSSTKIKKVKNSVK